MPKRSRRGGLGLGVPNEILGRAGRNQAIDAATGRQITSDASVRLLVLRLKILLALDLNRLSNL